MKPYTLRNFLQTHHGYISNIFITDERINEDSPEDENSEEYKNWYNKVNKKFKINMDLAHTNQKLEDFTQLFPYYNLEIVSWNICNDDWHREILEVYLK